jgi:hypothetical protein
MRRSLLRGVWLAVSVCWLPGCCVFSLWSSSANQALNLDVGKLGTGQQAVFSPNQDQPWKGDAVEKIWGF